MPDTDDLLARKGQLDTEITDGSAAALSELLDAKAAYRADASEANRARKRAAAENVQRFRAVQRAGRTGHAVGGDAYITTDGTEG